MPLDSGLYGPHLLTKAGLLALTGEGPGVYALGSKNSLGGLNVSYVGRADYDLISRLGDHVATAKYTHFKFGFTQTRLNAYHQECRLFHMFGGYALDNAIHPANPSRFPTKCRHCGA